MKSLLLLTILASLAPLGLSAQQPSGRSPELRKQPATQPQRALPPSLGAQQSAGTRPATGLAWRRGIYRQLELTQPANTPLYAEGEDGQSLFDLIMQLYLEGKIKGYTYGTGRERLDAAHVLEPRDFLERFRIPYAEVAAGGKPRYEVLPADLPTSQVRSYYLKEQYSLDRATTSYRREVELLCPILETVGDYGTAPMPLFWLRYSELAPYLRERPTALMPGGSPDAGTLEDYFTLGLYRGEIVKADHDPLLLERAKSPEERTALRQRLEDELQQLRRQISVPDSLRYLPPKDKTAKAGRPAPSRR